MSEDHDDASDLEWVPPTAAEQKVINARRERSDKISKLMGNYLLKGNHMFSRICKKLSPFFAKAKIGVLCPWTMSEMVQYKGKSFKKDQRVALYFTMSDIVHRLHKTFLKGMCYFHYDSEAPEMITFKLDNTKR